MMEANGRTQIKTPVQRCQHLPMMSKIGFYFPIIKKFLFIILLNKIIRLYPHKTNKI
ncbi:hypothetical protein KHDHEBDM_02331 [Pectobacterium polaris]|nr:hypothetical protein KHDHEBDM_02331 [Pectobacterium polaris]